jgi:hypothetical protein
MKKNNVKSKDSIDQRKNGLEILTLIWCLTFDIWN